MVFWFAAFSRPHSRCYPLTDRFALLRLLCADETCCAKCLSRRAVTAQLRFLLSTLLLDMKHDTTDYFM